METTKTVKCPKCGGDTPSSAVYCPDCGADMDFTRNAFFCIRCGQPLEAGAKFCAYCREPVPNVTGKLNDVYTQLIEQAIGGDMIAFRRLYERQYNNLYYIALSMVRNPHDAEDMVQNTFIQAWKSIKTLQSPYAFKGWITKILSNNCMQLIKKKKPVLFEDGDDSVNDIWEDNIEFLPADILDKDETMRLIREIVDKLPEAHRQAVILHYFQMLSIKEIAEIVNVSEGTVKSRLHYARNSIKAGVEEHEEKGIKLYTVIGLPLLSLILSNAASETALSSEAVGALWKGVESGIGITVTTASVSGASASSATGTAGGGKAGLATTAIKTKIIIGVLGVAAVGGIAAAVTLNQPEAKPDITSLPAVEEAVIEEAVAEGLVSREAETVDTTVVEAITLEEESNESIEEFNEPETWQDFARLEIVEFVQNGYLLEDINRIGGDRAYVVIIPYSEATLDRFEKEPAYPTLLWRIASPDGSDEDWFLSVGDYPQSSRLTIYVKDGIVQMPSDEEIEAFISSYPVEYTED